MTGPRVPGRLRWAVGQLDVGPDDRVLEIGCGPGVAVSLICQRLAGGRITAIDRSATAVRRATELNAAHVAAGRAVLEQVALAELDPAGRRFDVIFAVNVNLFWVRPAAAELRILKGLLRDGGTLSLFYEAPDRGRSAIAAAKVVAAVRAEGFSAASAGGPAAICIRATLPGTTPPRRSS